LTNTIWPVPGAVHFFALQARAELEEDMPAKCRERSAALVSTVMSMRARS
jgi:hypothetical protein